MLLETESAAFQFESPGRKRLVQSKVVRQEETAAQLHPLNELTELGAAPSLQETPHRQNQSNI